MQCCGSPPAGRAEGRARLELADIFRGHGRSFLEAHDLSIGQLKVVDAILSCRTAVLGGHVDVCLDCGHERPSYNSCRNRHCPKCQALPQARWIAGRKERILPTHYFHVVFTLPAELRPLALRNRRLVFDLLFDTASAALLELGKDPRRLGAQLGITAVLHTWSRDLGFHPHLHCVVTGGGLAPEGDRWVPARAGYLFPVKALSSLFRGKLLAALRKARDNGSLVAPDDFHSLLARLYAKDWVVYAKRPFGGPRQVFDYLGRYTHRVAISNSRLLAFRDGRITFLTRGGKSMTLPAHEFIRRFLLHVLPPRFHKIRHFGLMASANATSSLEAARLLLEAPLPQPRQPPSPVDWMELYRLLTGSDLRPCPRCGSSRTRRCPIDHATVPIVEQRDTS